MDTQAVVAELQRALNDPMAHSDPDSPLRQAIRNQPDLSQFDEQFHFQVSGWTRATHEGLAYWLLSRAQGTDPETAVADLNRYTFGSTLPCTHIMVLGGVRVGDRVAIDPATELWSFDALVGLGWADRIAAMYQPFHETCRPTAALVQREEFPKQVTPPTGEMPFPNRNLYQSLGDVRLCMTAIGPSCPVWLGSWTELDDWVPTYGSAAAIPNPYEMGGFPLRLGEADWGMTLPGLFASWRKLRETERQHLRVPLERLNRALRNVPLVDSAIELGIAIDALFLAEREADRGEQTLTLRLRAARYMANDFDERRRLGKVFGALYKARSMAVHAGKLDEKTDGFKTHALLHEGYSLTGRALVRIIEEGEPDWTGLLYL